MIKDKFDVDTIEKIIALGYPNNSEQLDELLDWTADPNWPVASPIYSYFIKLGKAEAERVIKLASRVDEDWRYSIITYIISFYDKEALACCTEKLLAWARQPGSQECDFESLRILKSQQLVDESKLNKIAANNINTYQIWLNETKEIINS